MLHNGRQRIRLAIRTNLLRGNPHMASRTRAAVSPLRSSSNVGRTGTGLALAREASGVADPADVAERAEDWTDEVLTCRTWSHRWQPLTATWSAHYHVYSISHRCGSCGTIRHQEIGQSGRLGSQWYEYPAGYLSKGLGRITGDARDVIRLAAVTRTFEVVKKTRAQDRDEAPSVVTRRKLGIA